ncbi:MAG: AAA family ATPase [Flavobacteriales bacterium]|nr:AAA family ATPase [Flavobacteriales bacterium]
MKAENFISILRDNLQVNPTEDQQYFIRQFASFILEPTSESVFILRGYAGTGKTTMVKTIVTSLNTLKIKSVLLAPTGRAAKVLANYSGKSASTIHRRIYKLQDQNGSDFGFTKVKNKSTNTIFIVDESSMISGSSQSFDGLFGGSNLLSDLIEYVLEGEHCKLLFIGDVAQLPPVGEKVSPSLSQSSLLKLFGLDSKMVELKEVLRQEIDSGILSNATLQRERLVSGEFKPSLISNQTDVIVISGQELGDYLESSYGRSGIHDAIVLCRSNKRANQFNQEIRTRLLFREEEVESSDLLMVVKNNYFWLEPTSTAGFIANGDTMEVLKVIDRVEKHGFRFATCEVKMIDYPKEPAFECKLLLDTIMADGPSLTKLEHDKLYHGVLSEYAHIRDRKLRFQKIKEDPIYNALQVKFAYAVTCHKAQGGQWKEVFIDQGYITEEMLGIEYMRWIYTAITRASEKLYLLNFSPEYLANYESE